MGRSPCCDESGLKKGPWTPEEDQKLVNHIQKHGHGSWRALPKLAGLNRCGKSCRLRWTNYLRPDIKRGKFTQEEEQTILNLHSVLGNKWSAIATHLPGRTDNEIKNFWNTHLKKKLIQMGFDPMTHRPRTDIFSSLPHLMALANLKELLESQTWEEQAVRLQTEAAQMAKLQYLQYLIQPPPNNNNIVSEMDTFSLLNSLSSMKDSDDHSLIMNTNQFMTHDPNLSSSSSSLQSLQDTINFSHMPDLQIPCGFQTLVDKDQENMVQPYETQNSSPSTSPWFPSTSSPVAAPLMITEANSLTTNNSGGGGGGDACSTNSSYEGGLSSSPFWPEVLLEDTLFNELAS